MTGPPAHGQEPIDRWLADRHHSLRDGLERFLDIEAGVRDAMLSAEHSDLLSDLDNRLDTEAGLAAILEPPTDSPQQRPGIAAVITAADPAVRMALRRDPIVTTIIISDLVVRALEIADGFQPHPALARDLADDVDRAVDRKIGRTIFGLALARECARELARAIAFDLDRARECALDLALALGRNLARDTDLAGVLDLVGKVEDARSLAREIVLASDLDHARDLARDILRVLAYQRGRDRGIDRVLDRALARDITLASNIALADDLDLDRAGDLDRALARDLARAREIAAEFARDLRDEVVATAGARLGLWSTDALPAALLNGVLDDFTRADLTGLNLGEADLLGVRWSTTGTRWPRETDTDALIARSDPIASDIYVIRNPGRGRGRDMRSLGPVR